MSVSVCNILEVLEAYDIRPFENDLVDTKTPDVGEILESETLYATSLSEVFENEDQQAPGVADVSSELDPRLQDWREQVERLISVYRTRLFGHNFVQAAIA